MDAYRSQVIHSPWGLGKKDSGGGEAVPEVARLGFPLAPGKGHGTLKLAQWNTAIPSPEQRREQRGLASSLSLARKQEGLWFMMCNSLMINE